MKKRILPVLLALCMVMSLLPVSFAEAAKNDDCACDACECTGDDHVVATCETCKACAKCNPCTYDGCTNKADGHDGAHANTVCKGDLTAADGKGVCGATNHIAGCGKFVQCTFGGEGGKCTKENGHADAHNNTKCAGTSSDGKCGARTHTGSCDMKCTCDNEKHTSGCTNTIVEDETLCASCLKSADCNPCTKADQGCTLYDGHPGAHNGATCTEDAKCVAKTHTASCPMCCGNSGNVGDSKDGVSGCTLTVHHGEKHNTNACLGATNEDTRCPGADGIHTKGCANFKLCPTCQIGMTEEQIESLDKCVGHAGDHENKICLGYNDDKHCNSAISHIAGCSKAKCVCQTDDAELKHEGCTGEAGCPACAALENCDCPVCRANPGMGVVTDENGNPVDPTEPTDPEVPSKAEDFTDMEDWMAADVQVALDKGWLEGYGDGTFNGRGVTSGATIAAVLARMDGETITGRTWAMDALKWAADQDAFEGIDLTGDSMARKDLVLVIWRMAGKPAAEKELEFTDVDGLEGDHLTAMQWAVENGIVKGNGDGTVTPDGSVNRAALCAMLARYDALEK